MNKIMNKIIKITFALLFVVFGATAQTSDSRHQGIEVRLGYNIGGTMPLGMPAEIRALNTYKPQLTGSVGVSTILPMDNHWGIMFGAFVSRKAMEIDAEVKMYHMSMTQGTETIEGLFSGNVVSKYSTVSINLPIQLAYSPTRKLTLRVGPYADLLLSKNFSGYAYDGYLRKNTPTGERVEVGSLPEERGDYAFKNDLRDVQFGVDFGIDKYISHGYGVYADFQWGLNGVFNSNFNVIEQTMHPAYASMGIVKRF